MNTIGINHNLDRKRIRKLLIIGLFASVMTGIGDFLLGYAEETPGANLAANIMAGAAGLKDWQMIAGGLLGFFGIFLEGLCFFAIYRLMADRAPKYAHIYRSGIFIYIWLAPVGCHLNVGILNMAYKYLLQADQTIAASAAQPLIYGFSLPVYLLLIPFWGAMIAVQFLAFSKGYTPYPKYARWFNLLTGALPAVLLGTLIGAHTALGAAVITTLLSCGNAFTFGGLLWSLPDEETFERFEKSLTQTIS